MDEPSQINAQGDGVEPQIPQPEPANHGIDQVTQPQAMNNPAETPTPIMQVPQPTIPVQDIQVPTQPVQPQVTNSSFQEQPTTNSAFSGFSAVNDNQAVFMDEPKKKNSGKFALIALGISLFLVIGGAIGYFFFFSPAAVNSRYLANIKPIIQKFSDLNKEGEDINFNYSSSASALATDEAERTKYVTQTDKALEFITKYKVEYAKLKTDFAKAGKPVDDAKTLHEDLVSYFAKLDDAIPDLEKMTEYFKGLISNNDFFKLSTLNYSDMSNANLDVIIQTSKAAEDKINTLVPTDSFTDFNDGLKTFVHLNSVIAEAEKELNNAMSSNNYTLYQQKIQEITSHVTELQSASTKIQNIPSDAVTKYKEVDDLQVKINDDLNVLVPKYKTSPFGIYQNSKQKNGEAL